MRDYSQYINQKFGKLTVLFAFQREDGKKVIRKNTYFHCKFFILNDVLLTCEVIFKNHRTSDYCDVCKPF